MVVELHARPTEAAAAPDALGAATGRPSASALGADFRKKLGSEGQDAGSLRASMPAAPPAAAEEWHVAINDVPVGPIKRDEIARKIGTGQVTGDSLAWREGFDDWRPLRDIPQLASLLEQRRRPSVPPAPRAATTTSRPSGPRTRTSGSGAGPLPASDRSSSNLVPLGGRAAAPVAPPANVMPDSEDADDFALDFARSIELIFRVAPALRPGLASVNVEPWPTSPSPEPAKVEWTRAPEVQALIQEVIDGVNKKFARVEQIKKFFLLDTQLTAEDEELTPTMKLKRKLVQTKYAAQIDAMYR